MLKETTKRKLKQQRALWHPAKPLKSFSKRIMRFSQFLLQPSESFLELRVYKRFGNENIQERIVILQRFPKTARNTRHRKSGVDAKLT